MKIVLSGLQPDLDVDALRERMARFGPVGLGESHEVGRRIDGILHMGRFIRARVLGHV